jgi:serine/threonine protein phosphatase PrpC
VTAVDVLPCPSCGAPTAAGDLFCEACGGALAAPATVPVPAPSAPAATATATAAGAVCVACGADADQIEGGYCGVCGRKQPARRDHLESEVGGRIDAAAVTDRGRRHPRNEDAFALATRGDGTLVAIVCDGVSTTVDPDAASQAAADAALASLMDADPSADDAVAHAAAWSAAVAAVAGLQWTGQGDLGPPSCTYLAALVHGDGRVVLATAGDCRSFWFPADGDGELLTEDDSWAGDQVRTGAMSEADALSDPRAHTITRWIGEDADPTWQPAIVERELTPGGRLLLCSDGLWNDAPRPEDVAAAADLRGPLLTTSRALVDFANAAGGHDNITVILVDLKGPSAP